MAFATLAGLPLPVEKGGGAELPREVGGVRTRTFNGGRRSTIRWEKRAWQFKCVPMLPATVATLIAAINLGQQVTLTGDVVDGAALTVDCELQDQQMMTGTGSPVGFWRIVTIRCYEV